MHLKSDIINQKMAKSIIILLILTFSLYSLSAQSKHEVDSLLNEIGKIDNLKDITKNLSAVKLISYDNKILKLLASCFRDTSLTGIKSDCHGVILKRGEIAIIIADKIEMMPYALLTGIQNCLLQFCNDNPNLVEFYLEYIRRDGVTIFHQNYIGWLISNDRKKWLYNTSNKKVKKRY
jgi:hypothetical protein